MRSFEGIKVLDLTENLSGNLTTMYLANFGAEVIKVEKPTSGDKSRNWQPQKEGKSLYFAYLNRGKKSITIDIHQQEGIDVLKKLITDVDVICESLGAEFMEKNGLGYEHVQSLNPKIIYASQSYFGHTGPYKKRPGSSCSTQALGVTMDMTGVYGGPPIKSGPSMGEHYTAGYLASGIMLALINKQLTGEGQKVDVSLLDSLFSTIEAASAAYSLLEEIQTRKGNFDPACAPYDTFETNDGFVAIGVANELQWQNLCKHVINMPELIEHPVYYENEGRCKDYLHNLRPILAEYLLTCSKYDIERLCREVGIPSGEVLDVPSIVDHPHIVDNGFLTEMNDKEVGKVKIPTLPIALSETPAILNESAPLLGENTDEVLSGFGFSKETISELKFKKIV